MYVHYRKVDPVKVPKLYEAILGLVALIWGGSAVLLDETIATALAEVVGYTNYLK